MFSDESYFEENLAPVRRVVVELLGDAAGVKFSGPVPALSGR